MEDIYEYYNTPSDFYNAITTREVTKPFVGRQSSNRSGGSTFHGTNSFEEAESLFKTGDQKTLGMLEHAIARVKTSRKMVVEPKTKIIRDVVGFTPDVASFVAGDPVCMMNVRKAAKLRRTPVLNLVLRSTYGYSVTAAEAAKKLALVLSAIKAIEKRGIRVALYSVPFSGYDKSAAGQQNICCIVKAKEPGESLNLLRLAFLFNPAFFRRFGFRWVETTPGIIEQYSCGYGYEVSIRKAAGALLERIFHGKAYSTIDYNELELLESVEDVLKLIQEKAG